MSAAPSRSESVADRIRDEILNGTYKPGERLPAERNMAGRLGVNRGSVREALVKLEQLGLVEIRRGGGSTVRHLHDASVEIIRHLLFVGGAPNHALVAQLLDAEEMVTAGAARLAVERASDPELASARGLVSRLGDPRTREADLPRVISEIVDLITDASGNLVLRLFRNTVRPVLDEALGPPRPLGRGGRRVLAQRVRAIDAALARRDAGATEEAVRSLLRDRRARLKTGPDSRPARSAPRKNPDPRRMRRASPKELPWPATRFLRPSRPAPTA
ncbi:MAG: GntR family transcriptional regulator [Myxococcota bacterium]